MKPFFQRLVSYLLVVCLAGLPFTAQAGLIGTDEVVALTQTQTERARVLEFVSRTDVQQQLQQQGLAPQVAKARVDALTDAEVQQIAGKIDALPAGATAGEAGAVAVLLLVIVITYFLVRQFYPVR